MMRKALELEPGDRVMPRQDVWHKTAWSLPVISSMVGKPTALNICEEHRLTRVNIVGPIIGIVVSSPIKKYVAIQKMSGWMISHEKVVFVVFPTASAWFDPATLELL